MALGFRKVGFWDFCCIEVCLSETLGHSSLTCQKNTEKLKNLVLEISSHGLRLGPNVLDFVCMALVQKVSS